VISHICVQCTPTEPVHTITPPYPFSLLLGTNSTGFIVLISYMCKRIFEFRKIFKIQLPNSQVPTRSANGCIWTAFCSLVKRSLRVREKVSSCKKEDLIQKLPYGEKNKIGRK
jgi:hypothetical protein